MKTKRSWFTTVTNGNSKELKFSKFLLLTSAFIFLDSCSVFMPVTVPEIKNYQISVINDLGPGCKNLVGKPNIQVTRMKADEPYDSDNMFYSLERYQVSRYSRNQWVASPTVMITKTIQEKLLQSCDYAHVVNADFLTNSDYRLNSQLIELQQNIRDGKSEIVFAILVQLVDNKTNQVVKGKTFLEKLNVEPNQHGYVVGVNKVVDKFLNDLTIWLK